MKSKEEVSMITVTDKVYDKALSLPANDRIGLVERLLSSLNLPTQPDVDKLWADEAERRVAQIDNGEVELIPGETVFERIRQRYRR
ncbi:MAG: addiction module protein [bacterium]